MEQEQQNPGIPFPGGEIMTKTEAARYLSVCTKTIESYVHKGIIHKWKNKVNGYTFYDKSEIFNLLGSRLDQRRDVVVYARAANLTDGDLLSTERRLESQLDRVLSYCSSRGIQVDQVITDIGEGTSISGRKGFDRLMEMIFRKEVSLLVIENPDRIARWAGRELIERFLEWHRVELHIINKCWETDEYRIEAKEDLTNILYQAKLLMGEKIMVPRPGEMPSGDSKSMT